MNNISWILSLEVIITSRVLGPNVYPFVILMDAANLKWASIIIMPIGFPTQEHGLLFHLSQASFAEHNAFWIYYFSKAINKHKTIYHLFQLCKKKGIRKSSFC